MRNKELFQNKIAQLESINTGIGRATSINDRDKVFELLERSREVVSDLQTMLNRE